MMQAELLKECLTLGNYTNLLHSKTLRDVSLGNFVIGRSMPSEFVIYFLYNGDHIHIPWEWIDIFKSYNTGFGHRAQSIAPQSESSVLDKFIYLSLKAVIYYTIGEGERFVKLIAKLSEIGTSEFRKWYKDEFDKDLPSIDILGTDKSFSL